MIINIIGATLIIVAAFFALATGYLLRGFELGDVRKKQVELSLGFTVFLLLIGFVLIFWSGGAQ
ncbi:MAG: hypothetical protein ACU0A5_10705 [Salipiger marinus]|jgi:hypothetical protein|uniref:hypothetical protein n=1 Tax=Salipiger marinus TaxID=555512 RepID=UPI00405A1A18